MAARGSKEDLILLQSRCKKDPGSYQLEFETQQKHFAALLLATHTSPSDPQPNLIELVSFIAHIAPSYPPHGTQAAQQIINLVSQNKDVLDRDLRYAMIRALAILRAKKGADQFQVLKLYFEILSCKDKNLRKLVMDYIVADIKRANRVHRDEKLNKQLQNMMFSIVKEKDELRVKKTIQILKLLFFKRVWNDTRTVNVIADACFHPSIPVVTTAMHFFVDEAEKDYEDNDDDDDDNDEDSGPGSTLHHTPSKTINAKLVWQMYHRCQKKSTRKKKKLERSIARANKSRRSSNGGDHENNTNLSTSSPIMLIHDPQEFAERLFSDLQNRRKTQLFQTKLLFLNFISKLVGTHQLTLLNLYPYLQRYLQPHQDSITLILVYLAQACHDQVPPDVITPLVRSLADNFVSDRCSTESIAGGLNAIRAICARAPLAIEADPDSTESGFLQELVEFKDNRDKSVSIAARGLLQLFREINPALLKRKDRGKDAIIAGNDANKPQYGAQHIATHVQGIELLAEDNDQFQQSSSDDVVADGDRDRDTEGVGIDYNSDDSDQDDDSDNGEEKQVEDDNNQESDVDLPEESPTFGIQSSRGRKDNRSGIADKDSEQDEDSDDSDGDPNENDDDSDDDVNSHSGDESSQGAYENDDNKAENNKNIHLDKKRRLDISRILTDEDFARIDEMKAEKLVARTFDPTGRVTVGDIESVAIKKRKTLEERLESVRAGREDRMKFGSRKGRKDKGGGTSNRAKMKMKDSGMIIHKKRSARNQKAKFQFGKKGRKKQKGKNGGKNPR